MAYQSKKILCGIYQITHLSSCRVYIGSSNHIYKRWGAHRSALNNNRHENRYLQFAWNKYGEDQFRFEIVELVDKVNIAEREKYWMDKTGCLDRNRGFNIFPDPTGLNKPPLSEEHKRKISETFKGRTFSDEHRKNLSIALKGKKKPAHVIEAARQANIGKPWTKAQREKRSILSKGSNNARARIVEVDAENIKHDLVYGYHVSFLSKKYSVTEGVVRRILNGESWRHVLPNLDVLAERNKRLKIGKVCLKCGIWKKLDGFSRNKARCKVCRRAEYKNRSPARMG